MSRSAAVTNDLSALAAARAITGGSLSSRALTEDCLARIAARKSTVEAWHFLDPAYALAQADAMRHASALWTTTRALYTGCRSA